MKTLHTIDFLSPSAAVDFTESLKDYGFAALRHHPLDMRRVQRIYRQWLAFFLSEEKHQFPADFNTQDGYFSVSQAESAKGFQQQDYKEYFHFYGWGRCPDRLRSDLEDYYTEAHQLAATLLGWIEDNAPSQLSEQLSQPLSHMVEGSDRTLLRVLHYPALSPDASVIRAAPHEDINLLTILPAAEGPGLEVKQKDGSWLTVEPDPDTVVVNIGDMLQEATAGYYPSTTHQVAIPRDEQRFQSRMALPLFLHPRPEVVLSERYTAASYLEERLREMGVK